MTYANISLTLQNELGETERIENVQSAEHNDGVIEVTFLMSGGTHTEEYDELSWDIDAVRHTETPIGE